MMYLRRSGQSCRGNPRNVTGAPRQRALQDTLRTTTEYESNQ
jgi:hypothetical protein